MYQVNPIFKVIRSPPRSSKKKKRRLPQKTYSPENDHLNWTWYNPPEESAPVTFCLNTSLHGLKYIGQQQQHIFERVFWLVAFVASLITAAVLIWGMWNDYRNTPIVTVFNPTELDLDTIPFPSITICNVNGLQKSIFDWQTVELAKNIFSFINPSEELLQATAFFVDMNYICDSTLTFVDNIVGNSTILQWFHKVKEFVSENLESVEKYLDPRVTLRKVSQPCEKMILHCIWLNTVTNCSNLFQPIETDYGSCCTFNAVPLSLLLRNHTDKRESAEKVKAWKAANLNYENILFTDETENRTYPYRQKYPGRLAGLSLLLDPDLKEYFCTNTDSKGFIMGINVPLDYPKLKDTGIAISTNSEVFVGVRPEITMSEDTMTSYSVEKRQCYYGNEYQLPHYMMYTTSNCMDECITRKTLEHCGCVRYYMPHNHTGELCRPQKYNCTERLQASIFSSGLSKVCKECLPTCTEIQYHKEVTLLPLQESRINLLKTVKHNFNVRDVSIVHVYFNTDSVYPRLRKQLTSMTQLMSNTGGLLGLCMGFSVLSLLEIFYYGTIRICCSFYRNKIIRDNGDHDDANYMDNTKKSNHDVESFNPKQSWFSKIFNNDSSIRNVVSNQRSMNRRIPIEDRDENDVFKVHSKDNLPVYYRGTFEDQFQRAFLTNFSETYPK